MSILLQHGHIHALQAFIIIIIINSLKLFLLLRDYKY